MPVLLSIIIPAFNVENYLSACLDSVIKQKDAKLEVVIVNDGSTDSTGNIADCYAQKCSLIKVIHQPNQGVSAARNTGLLYAVGQYIWFVDGDDIVANDAIDFLNKTVRQHHVDIIFFNYEQFFNSLKLEQLTDSGLSEISFKDKFRTHLPFLIRKRVLTYSPCDKLIKRELLLKNKIQFNIDLIYAEDYYWNYKIFNIIDTFIFTDKTLYFYRKNRVHSATTQLSLSHLESAMQALELSVSDIVSKYTNKNILESLLLYTSETFFYILPEFYKARNLNKENSLKFYNIYGIYKKNNVELDSLNRGSKVFERMYRLLPWYHTVRLYSQIIIFRRTIQLYVLKKVR